MPQPTFGPSNEELATRPLVYAPALLKDQVALISGGGGSIGKATAWLAARLGARVIICGRSSERLDKAAEAMRERGHFCETLELDIRDRAAVDAGFTGIFERHGRIDLLVNSAGGQFPQPALDFSLNGWRAVIDTNLNGTFNMMQSVARQWRDANAPGSIVTIVVSPRGLHQVAHTCAARAGVEAFSQAVAVEWAPLGIRVNCIAPGTVESEGWAVYAEKVRSRYPDSNPLRAAGSVWDVAEACIYIGGPPGRYITGHTLNISGGSHLWGETWTYGKPDYFVEASQSWEDSYPPQ